MRDCFEAPAGLCKAESVVTISLQPILTIPLWQSELRLHGEDLKRLSFLVQTSWFELKMEMQSTRRNIFVILRRQPAGGRSETHQSRAVMGPVKLQTPESGCGEDTGGLSSGLSSLRLCASANVCCR